MRSLSLVMFLVALFMVPACSDDTDRPVNDGGGAGSDSGGTLDRGSTNTDAGATTDGATAEKVEAYIPKDNEVSGWSEDTEDGHPGVEAGYTTQEIVDIIDGEHDDYATAGSTGFARQYYKKDFGEGCGATLVVYLWDMATAAGAKKMYNDKKSIDEDQTNLTFETIAEVQDEGVIAFNQPDWKVWAYKGQYLLKLSAAPTKAACNESLKTDVISWVKLITGKA